MAIYHFSIKPISRSSGRSATGAAAYRAGECIYDERTDLEFDYSHKTGVLYSELILPQGGHTDRSEFWNELELHHKRQDAILAREVEVSLPSELTTEQRQQLAIGFAYELANRYGVAADVALHAPRSISDAELKHNPRQYHEFNPELGHHNGNWHAHILLSACHVSPEGELGRKAVELDPIHCQRHHLENMANRERGHWAEMTNRALEQAGCEAQIDHRSHAERGFDYEPSQHLGPAAAGYERRTGEPSLKRLDFEQSTSEGLARTEELNGLEEEWQQVHRTLCYAQGQGIDGPILKIDRAEIEQGLAIAAAQYQEWQQMEKIRDQAQEQYQTWKTEQEQQRQQEQQQREQREQEWQAEQQRRLTEIEQGWRQLIEELNKQAEQPQPQPQQQNEFQHGL